MLGERERDQVMKEVVMLGEGDDVSKEAVKSGEGNGKVKLKSSDDQTFEVDELVAFQSQTVKDLVKDMGIEVTIPLPNIPSNILTKVIEYSKYHTEMKKSHEKATIPNDEVKKWDEEFANIDVPTLMKLIAAAGYLNIGPLLELTTGILANIHIKGKSTEEIRRTFGIVSTFTREEEAAIIQKNQWAYK